jgi:alpha-N-acetylglucosaminidase
LGKATGQPAEKDAKEVFELTTKDGIVQIAASGPNAAAVGLGWYLKYYCHRSMSHMGDNLSAVTPLPVIKEPVRVDASAQIRYALNYCTYNYTLSFYNWKDWEHELDWMALNGVNTMLVANGEEAVWQNVLRKIGYTQQEIDAYITGPAYNAWWLMGNIQGWGGPMPQTQIDNRKVLVQKMLARMKLLGIEPVMPAFFGMVPSTLKNKLHAHIITQGNWGAFTRPDILDPTDTAFDRIGELFYGETKKLYGKDIHYFSGDPFHEGGITEGVDLGKAGANIQKTMQRYFPGAVWVLQGWQENPRVEMLAGLDKSKVLVQELFGETTNNWEKRKGYEGTPFVWCMITNYGERPGLFGKLQRYADEPYRAANGEFGPYLKGVGIMPEGINNNPVAYDFMLEVGWHRERVDAAEWIKNYVLYRYGKYNEDILNAWKLFLQTIYSSPEGYQEGPPENILCARPALQIKSVSSWGTLKKNYDIDTYLKAAKLFANAASFFKGSEPYAIDLINFARQAAANRADTVFARLVGAYNQKDLASFNVQVQHFLALSDATDTLLNAHPYYRLSTYQQQALAGGHTAAEKKSNFQNAMMLITYWGENNPKEDYLHEYAYKEWAGMIQPFYKQRWELYFDYLRKQLKGEPATETDWFHWERQWEKEHEKIIPAPAAASLTPAVNAILSLCSPGVAQKKSIGNETPEEKQQRMAWWSHDRFGMFIHWGLYAQPARHEWVKRWERMNNDQYQIYFDLFNPDLFDPKTWARQAKAAGMKYAVLTTKHHEGFCLFDSKYTDYKAPNTAAKRDLVREFVDAFRAEGIKIGFYYSLLDWHHPDYTVDGLHPLQPAVESDSAYARLNKGRDWSKYRAYLHNQLKELLTNYGKIDILWLDFSYPNSNGHGKGRDDWGSVELLKMIRKLQPGILVDNRLDLDDYTDGADFVTPEQVKPSELSKYGGSPFETCQTFSGSWGYYRDENTWKTDHELLTLLITSVSKGGNLILNVGPTARGVFDYRAQRALDSIGIWMKFNSKAIYGCKEAPEGFIAPSGTLLTYNPETKRLYVHLMEYPGSTLRLPGYKGKIKYAQLLQDASEIRFKPADDNPDDLVLSLPAQKPTAEIPVIELVLP